jgi:hypothetical protein
MLVVEDGTPPVDVRAAVPAAVAVTVHDLTEDVMPGNFAGNFGLRGMAKWADAVADRRTAKGWARLYGSGPAFAHAMQRLHDCLTTDHSSPGAMRPMYAEFLTTAAALTGNAALAEAADGYARAGEIWSAVADVAAQAGSAELPEAERLDRLDAIAGLAARVLQVEREACAALAAS